ncbi:hypothetical protein LTR66_013029 [Elasticomyces elasticus]|nr:hypothetical protein LTR66_013029 [Elasticomyces elasticus]
MAMAVGISNVANIVDVGELEYSLVQPILKKVETAQQLRTIETNSPQIAGADAELWRTFIRNEIPWVARGTMPEPRDPTKWWKVYRKLKDEDKKKNDEAAEVLKAAFTKKQVEKELRTTDIIDRVIPLNSRAARHGASGSQSCGPRIGSLKNAKTGSDVMRILKSQNSSAIAARQVKQATPSHLLNQKQSQIHKAPAGMINEYAKAATPARPLPAGAVKSVQRPIFLSRKVAPLSARERELNAAIKAERAEKERRLRALTGAIKPSPPQISRPAPTAPIATAPQAPSAQKAFTPAQSSTPAPQPSPPGKLSASPESGKRKRKQVDIFMSSKRRVLKA